MRPPDRLVDVVVVGLDGADRSRGAVAWIAAVAPAGAVVHAVHAVRPASHPDSTEPRVDVAAWTDEVRAALAAQGTAATVVSHEVEGSPAEVLIEVAADEDAALIVVGAHDQVFEHPRLLGRTVGQLVHESPVPVVVVGAHHAARQGGTVVAGVGTGSPTDASVGWAAAFAEFRGAGLGLVRAVHRTSIFTPEGVLGLIAYYLDPSALPRWAREDLDRIAAEVQAATESDLPIEVSSPVGKVGPELVEAAEDAELLVIGRPERPSAVDHTVPGWLHHAIVHAPCPIVIVPGHD